jgi:hypothetical protein
LKFSKTRHGFLGELQRSRMPRETIQLISLIIVIVSMSMSFASSAWGQLKSAAGYDVKTAFLFNFAKFIDWPERSFATPNSPFSICVLGEDPFGNALDETLQMKMIGDRPIIVKRLKDKVQVRGCQMVFVSSSESAHLNEIVGSVQGINVLLVGETSGFALAGGTIEFTLEDNHVRFTINADAAARSGLMFSSKLLALAKIVHDQEHSKGG